MPTHTGKDAKGCFAQWGGHGAKYYFTCNDDAARKRAIAKADAQGRAAHAHGYVGNADPSVRHFQYVTTNLKPVVRQDTLEGKDHVVVPTQMITEGVHNGSDGAIFYPASELAKISAAYNHKPVVVYHPVRNGIGISACDPIELTARKVGILLNTQWDDKTKKLSAESWLDPSRIDVVDKRVSETISKNEMMEVSTGLFLNLERTPGEWNGEEYIGIARNIQPDHLALLPDMKGACSIEDGAGFLRMNQEGETLADFISNAVDVPETGDYIHFRMKDPKLFDEDSYSTIWISKSKGIKARIGKLKSPAKGQEGSTVVQVYLFDKSKWTTDSVKTWIKKHKGTNNIATLIVNELSFDSIQMLLRGALRAKHDNAWITDTFDDHFIYEEDGKMYSQEYTIDEGNVQFNGLPKLVERIVSYKEVGVGNETKSDMKGNTMDKKQKVDALIANEKTSWTEEHREKLMALDEDVLTNMLAPIVSLTEELVKATTNKDKKDDKKQDTTVTDNKANTTQPAPKPQTAKEYVENAPPEIRDLLESSMATLNAEKARLTQIILANKQNSFTPEHLGAMKMDMLKALAALAAPVENERQPIPLYFGQQPVAPISNAKPVEPLGLPVMNFGQEDDKKKTA